MLGGDNINRNPVLLAILILVVALFALPLNANAYSRTIIVPDDYPTITDAIENAIDGDIIHVKRGTYEGPLNQVLEINKSISLIGEGAEFTTLNLHPELTISCPPGYPPDLAKLATSYFLQYSMKVEAKDFRLKGFTIGAPDMAGYAIKYPNVPHIPGGTISIKGNQTQIEDNYVAFPLAINSSRCSIVRNTLTQDIGIIGSYSNITENDFSGAIRTSGSYLNISANRKSSSNTIGVSDSGINVDGSYCRVSGNNLTAKYLNPAIGVNGNNNIVAKNSIISSDIGMTVGGSCNIICGNRITNCLDSGFFPGYPPPIVGIGIIVLGNNTIYANHVAENTWGLNVNQFPENSVSSVFYHNNFVKNRHQVAAVEGMSYGSDVFDNGTEGNYWSDYDVTDANNDGVGDLPYHIDNNRIDHYPLKTPFDIDSIAEPLLSAPAQPSGSESQTMGFNCTLLAIGIAFTIIFALAGIGLLVHLKKYRR